MQEKMYPKLKYNFKKLEHNINYLAKLVKNRRLQKGINNLRSRDYRSDWFKRVSHGLCGVAQTCYEPLCGERIFIKYNHKFESEISKNS